MKNEPALQRQAYQIHRRYGVLFILFAFLSPIFLSAQQPVLKSFKDASGKYGFKNDKGIIIVEATYDRVFEFKEGLAPVILDKKYGFVDREGKEVIPVKYQAADYFKDNITRIQLNDKWGYIDKTGKEIIPPIYQSEDTLSEGLIRVKLNDKWGFIDKTGKEIIPFKYPAAGNFKEDLAWAATDTKYGFIDKTGKEVIPFKYQSTDAVSEGLIRVKLNDKWGVIDKTGKQIVEEKYQTVGNFKDGVAWVQLENKWGYINRSGKEITPIKYELLYGFFEGIARVKANKKYGLIDKTGSEVVELKYDSIGITEYGRARAKLNNKWGYINVSGKEIIPLIYDEVDFFSFGMARVKLDNKYGYYNVSGKEIVPVKYQKLDQFLHLFGSLVQSNDKWGWLDSTGKETVPCIYDKFARLTYEDYNGPEGFSDGLAIVKLNGKWGVIDKTNKEIIPIKYEDVQNNPEGYKEFAAKLNNEWFFFDFKGNLTSTSKIGSSSTLKTATQTNTSLVKLAEPSLPMKGVFDPSLVGTWKYHSDAPNFNGYYIFRANGTYDYWSDMTSTKAPEPTNYNFWRVIGDELEVLPKGGKGIVRVKMFKRNDPQNNKPALVIEWNVGAEDYRVYYPTESKELWKINNTSTASSKSNSPDSKPAETVNLVEPPVKLNGNIDLSIIGLWKTTVTDINYWLDFKPDGTYDTWTSKNTRKVKCYWRIDKGFFESVCDGGNQKGRVPFKKINDLVKGKPTLGFDWSVYLPATDREMWK